MKRQSDDRNWIAAIDASYRPEPMNAWQRAAFHAGLAERLRERTRVRRNWLAVAASATAGLMLWLGTSTDRLPPNRPAATASVEGDATMPVVYAFVTPEQYGATLLPDDYAALADVLGLDGDSN